MGAALDPNVGGGMASEPHPGGGPKPHCVEVECETPTCPEGQFPAVHTNECCPRCSLSKEECAKAMGMVSNCMRSG